MTQKLGFIWVLDLAKKIHLTMFKRFCGSPRSNWDFLVQWNQTLWGFTIKKKCVWENIERGRKFRFNFVGVQDGKKIAPIIWRKDSLRLDKLGWEKERHKLSINSIIEFSFGKISFKRWLNFPPIECKTSNSKLQLQLQQKDWFFVILCLKW